MTYTKGVEIKGRSHQTYTNCRLRFARCYLYIHSQWCVISLLFHFNYSNSPKITAKFRPWPWERVSWRQRNNEQPKQRIIFFSCAFHPLKRTKQKVYMLQKQRRSYCRDSSLYCLALFHTIWCSSPAEETRSFIVHFQKISLSNQADNNSWSSSLHLQALCCLIWIPSWRAEKYNIQFCFINVKTVSIQNISAILHLSRYDQISRVKMESGERILQYFSYKLALHLKLKIIQTTSIDIVVMWCLEIKSVEYSDTPADT